MTRLVIALSIAALLLLAFALGWLCHWLWSRPERRVAAGADRLAQMAAQLHAAEASADAAAARAAAAEARLQDARDEIKAELGVKLSEARAELAAAMDALREARGDAAEWRAAYERTVGASRT
ncbi:MAG: hypothetical protein ACK4WC_03175 [Rubrimonas sp.]